MLNELLPTDLVNGDGTIKPEAQATILSGTQTSNNGFSPLQQAQQEISMNLMDYYNRKAPGSSYAALSSTKLKQRDDADEYNQKLIKRRNTGIEALMEIPSSKRAKAYPKLLEMLRGQGADVGMPEQYDEEALSLMKGKDSDWASKEYLKHQYRLAEIAARGQGEDELTKVMKREQAKDIVDAQKNTAESESAYEKFLGNKENINDLVKRAKPGIGEGVGTIARKIFDPKSDVLTARASLNSELRSNILTAAKALKGNLSDKDIKFLEEQAGDLSMTNDQLLAVYNTLENRMKIAKESSSEVLGSLKSNAGLSGNRQNVSKSTTGKTDYKSKYGLD